MPNFDGNVYSNDRNNNTFNNMNYGMPDQMKPQMQMQNPAMYVQQPFYQSYMTPQQVPQLPNPIYMQPPYIQQQIPYAPSAMNPEMYYQQQQPAFQIQSTNMKQADQLRQPQQTFFDNKSSNESFQPASYQNLSEKPPNQQNAQQAKSTRNNRNLKQDDVS
jgi:hypothetical protein